MITERNTPETDLLLQHFATLATGPGGVARLRELILQLAVQGKLGTQEPGDESLNEKVNKILRATQKTSGKKENFSKIEDDELYFSIPERWIVLRLGEICSIRAGGTPNRKNSIYWENGSIPWIKIQDIQEKYVTKSSECITEEGLKNSSAYLMDPDTILYTIFATIGKTGILKFKACCNQAIVGIKPNHDIVELEFLYLHLMAIQSYYVRLSRGLAQNNINQTILKNAPIFLPPLAEQHRIVEKVDRLMALCDQLEKQQQQERSTCLQLGTASFAGLQNAESPEDFERQWAQICDTFDLMLDCPENVAVLRQTILQLAVQGKLGTQDPGDESLNEKVNKILRATQKTSGKKENFSKIEDDELYFSIPERWIVRRLGEICSIRAGGTPNRKNSIYWENGSIPWIKIQDIQEKYVTKSSECITEEGLKNSSAYLMDPDTILYTIFATIGKAGILKFKACCNQAIVGIKPNHDIVELEFLYLHLMAIQNYYARLSRGLAQNNINQTILKNAPIFLPPLAEQHRIVEKVDQLMALCDQLEAQLKNRAGVQERFAKAVVGGIAT